GSVYIQSPGVYDLAVCEREDDPYVYYCSQRGESSYYVGRIDVARQTDEGELVEGGSMALSSDGALLYLLDRMNEASSLRIGRIVEGGQRQASTPERKMCPASVEMVAEWRHGRSSILTPGQAALAVGEQIASSTGKSSLGKFEFPVFAFMAGKPWAFGVKDRRLLVGSLNDKRTAAIVNLPESFAMEEMLKQWVADPVKQLFTRGNRVNPVFVDAQRGRVI